MGTENTVHTGYFNDGIRRIDIVLVMVDDGDDRTDEIKINYLINVLKLGLEIEVENGVMKSHKKMIFVKVHAPDSVIQIYGDVFSIRKNFKENHVEFIGDSSIYSRLLTMFLPCFFENREKEWIKIVRKQYPGLGIYSTLERSQIVYRMLLVLPFGKNENYLGLERLIHNNIVLDAYALHDGPYFFLPHQDIAHSVNARQILYNNWMGANILCKQQPYSLLQEYFGEKVAFYFAYSIYFNHALIITAAAGIFVSHVVYEETLTDWSIYTRRKIQNMTCFDEDAKTTYLCPRCKDFYVCGFYTALDTCTEAFFQFTLESQKMADYNIFIMMWGVVFIHLWMRREYYLSWLWELDMEGSTIIRPGYKPNLKRIRRSEVTGVLQTTDSFGKKMFYILKGIFILCVLLVIIFIMTLFWANFQYYVYRRTALTRLPRTDILGPIVFSVIYATATTILENVADKLTYVVNCTENHKTQDSFEKALITKQFGASFALCFPYYYFLAFVKGRLYTYPHDIETWQMVAGIGVMNCGLFTCVVELGSLLSVHVIMKMLIFKGIPAFFRYKTDYNQCRSKNAKVPCWEREYRLNNVNEKFIMSVFKDLALQFAFSTLFVTSFPLAPLLLLIGNTLAVRYNSWYLLLASRRPLLHDSVGIASWRNVMFAIAFLSVLTNVLNIVMNTRVAKGEFYEVMASIYELAWIPYFASTYPTENYLLSDGPGSPGEAFKEFKGFKPSHCLFLGTFTSHNKKLLPDTYSSESLNSYGQKLGLVQHLAILGAVLIVLAITLNPKDVKQTLAIESRIKTQCFVRRQLKGFK